jgi:hypothetical protein
MIIDGKVEIKMLPQPDFSFWGTINHEKYSAPASAAIKSSC